MLAGPWVGPVRTHCRQGRRLSIHSLHQNIFLILGNAEIIFSLRLLSFIMFGSLKIPFHSSSFGGGPTADWGIRTQYKICKINKLSEKSTMKAKKSTLNSWNSDFVGEQSRSLNGTESLYESNLRLCFLSVNNLTLIFELRQECGLLMWLADSEWLTECLGY